MTSVDAPVLPMPCTADCMAVQPSCHFVLVLILMGLILPGEHVIDYPAMPTATGLGGEVTPVREQL
ncbi:hypothetical protein IFO70_09440 [Phormidium tenue FACHB-886]|nr:hypothetical protein [Phormidium tenue FACHB-886]